MVYKDHNNLIPALADVKFIIVGRKGSGKSAFAEHMCSLAEDNGNMFTRFIRQGESNLEHIVQIGADHGHEIERENLYKWLILTNILKMFSENSAVSNNKDYEALKQFLSKNSGYIDIRESEVKELIKKQGFDISIEYLKRFFRSKMNKSLEIKQEKAAFYKLIPHLKEVVTKVLKSHEERTNKNSYVIFFDDLDINFSVDGTWPVTTTNLHKISLKHCFYNDKKLINHAKKMATSAERVAIQINLRSTSLLTMHSCFSLSVYINQLTCQFAAITGFTWFRVSSDNCASPAGGAPNPAMALTRLSTLLAISTASSVLISSSCWLELLNQSSTTIASLEPTTSISRLSSERINQRFSLLMFSSCSMSWSLALVLWLLIMSSPSPAANS